ITSGTAGRRNGATSTVMLPSPRTATTRTPTSARPPAAPGPGPRTSRPSTPSFATTSPIAARTTTDPSSIYRLPATADDGGSAGSIAGMLGRNNAAQSARPTDGRVSSSIGEPRP